MNEQKRPIDLNLFEENSPFFGQSLLRDVLLPNLLGNETNEILYWAGKEIARQYPLSSFEDTILFFERAGFGNLLMDKREDQTIVYHLTGTNIESRINGVKDLSFNLESGFLAEQIQLQESCYTEAYFEIDQKNNLVAITLKQDLKDLEPIEKSNPFFTLNKKNDEPDVSEISKEEDEKRSDLVKNVSSDNDKLKDQQLNEKLSIFEKWPSRSSKHTKKK